MWWDGVSKRVKPGLEFRVNLVLGLVCKGAGQQTDDFKPHTRVLFKTATTQRILTPNP